MLAVVEVFSRIEILSRFFHFAQGAPGTVHSLFQKIPGFHISTVNKTKTVPNLVFSFKLHSDDENVFTSAGRAITAAAKNVRYTVPEHGRCPKGGPGRRRAGTL
jgi:hypothetical protein